MTVWAVHPLGERMNLNSASQFGEVRYISDRYVYGDELDERGRVPRLVHDRLRAAADQFDANGDYLIIGGDHVQLLILSVMIGIRWNTFMALRWDRKISCYVPVCIQS